MAPSTQSKFLQEHYVSSVLNMLPLCRIAYLAVCGSRPPCRFASQEEPGLAPPLILQSLEARVESHLPAKSRPEMSANLLICRADFALGRIMYCDAQMPIGAHQHTLFAAGARACE